MREGRVLCAGPLHEIMTGERLSATYDTPIRVKDVDRQLIVLWR